MGKGVRLLTSNYMVQPWVNVIMMTNCWFNVFEEVLPLLEQPCHGSLGSKCRKLNSG